MRTMTLETCTDVDVLDSLPQPSACERRYVVYCELDGEVSEEIDVNAVSATEAKAMATKILKEHYAPGMRPVAAEEQHGLYF